MVVDRRFFLAAKAREWRLQAVNLEQNVPRIRGLPRLERKEAEQVTLAILSLKSKPGKQSQIVGCVWLHAFGQLAHSKRGN